ncbi:hypothetical protein AVEN_52384-1 [Araneus ventricosus]|uniref:Uncharacterized protein n=1 Tax=Araneus ventricosus TaxID=182803 RepID=A0A4Y2TC17_ARAVE|nr:hypothetical protein AVEN_52384-1 [Araneus ventricosus]
MRPFSRYLYYERKYERISEKDPCDVTAIREEYIRIALGSERSVCCSTRTSLEFRLQCELGSRCYGYRFGYEMVSSVGEFTTLSYLTTVLGQSSRLTTFARSVAEHIEIMNLPFAGAKGR